LLPVMLETAARLEHLYPGIQFVLAQAPTVSDDLLGELTAGARVNIHMIKDQASEVMAAADVVLVASGTATLQTAIVGTPMILMYRASLLTYWLARSLIRVKWIGLVNLVAGRSIVPEIIQHDMTPERLTEEAAHLLRDRAASRQMREALRTVRDALGEPGASQRAAAVVLAVCRT
jgi:lipid-A-disaccharide synthase